MSLNATQRDNSLRQIGIIFLMSLVFGNLGCVSDSAGIVEKRIQMVENEIPTFSDPNPFVVLLTSFNNMLNTEFMATQPRSCLDSLMIEYKIPGVSVAVIDDYKIDWEKGYGKIHAGREITVNTDTYFEAASTTKMLTAALVMKMVELGRFDLDTDVNEYLESWKIPDSPQLNGTAVTLRLLLSHMSGLSSGENFGTKEGETATIVDVLEGRDPATNTPAVIENEPGTVWAYSNLGFVVIQLILEDYLDRPYVDLMQEYIFDPLGMSRSTFSHHDKKAIRDEVIVPHDETGTPHEREMNATIKAHGELLTNPHDMALFAVELMKAYAGKPSKLFSQETARTMLGVSQKINPTDFFGLEGLSFGFGAFLMGEDDELYFMHPGTNNPGACTLVTGNPGTGKGAVIMTNGAQGLLLAIQMVSSISLAYDWNGGRIDD